MCVAVHAQQHHGTTISHQYMATLGRPPEVLNIVDPTRKFPQILHMVHAKKQPRWKEKASFFRHVRRPKDDRLKPGAPPRGGGGVTAERLVQGHPFLFSLSRGTPGFQHGHVGASGHVERCSSKTVAHRGVGPGVEQGLRATVIDRARRRVVQGGPRHRLSSVPRRATLQQQVKRRVPVPQKSLAQGRNTVAVQPCEVGTGVIRCSRLTPR